MTRRHARAARGERAYGSIPFGHRRRLTLLGALTRDGLVAVMTIQAATSAAVFVAFLKDVLVPEIKRRKPGAVLVMDNLSAHKDKAVQETVDEAGLRLRYLPRYSPDLSPIEPCWSKVKTILRGQEPRSVEELDRELLPAIDAVTPQDAKGWFRHCGYPTPN